MRASILFLFFAALLMHNNVLYADRAKPAVKIAVEVIVFEDGKVTVQGMPAKKFSPAKIGKKAKSDACCDSKACSKCNITQKPSATKKEDKMMTRKDSRPKWNSKSMLKKVADSIMSLDQNKDGRLNADEVQPRLRSPFSEVDSNGDGYLDRGEVARQIKRKMRND